MRFGLLGPLDVEVDGRSVLIGSAMHRALLSVLLLRANRPVAQGTLQTVLWGENPPVTAAASLKNHVSRLRRVLGDGAGERLRAVPSGYLLRVGPGELDVEEFLALAGAAREARARQDWPEARRATGAALGVWRGVPLDGMSVDVVDLEVRHLAETHRDVLEWHFDAALRLGIHDGLAGRLTAAVVEHPLVETFSVQLMLVLHRSGRSAQALEVYQQLRRTLVEELGLEPSATAQALQRQILESDAEPGVPNTSAVSAKNIVANANADADANADQPAPIPSPTPAAPPAPLPKPAHLPADLPDFTGREDHVRDLCALLTGSATGNDNTPRPLTVCTITGMGGAGKTALAVHVAHRVKNSFPDGQLYINLRGRDPSPRSPDEILRGFLHDLDVPDQSIPVDTEAKAARFRSLTAGRRLLVVLDNARDAAQVRPLLPGTGSCAVLVTSRHKLSGLDGAAHFDLDGLDPDEARALFGRIIGPRRAAAEPEAAEAVLRCCAGLPLAVRIAGARLAGRGGWPVAALADRLADERRRLDELRLADVAVRGCFQVSYAGLEASTANHALDAYAVPLVRDPARALRLLGLCGASEISLPAAAALFGDQLDAAESDLEALVEACLLDNPRPDRYRLHDLLRVYAAERSAQEPEDERVAAVRRLASWTLATLAAADAVMFPNTRRPQLPALDADHPAVTFPTREAAQAWCDQEAPALATTAATAAAHGLHALAWLIPAYAMGYFRQSCRYPEWSALNATGLASARVLGDPEAEARLLSAQSSLHLQTGGSREAEDCIRAALAIRRAMRDEVGELAQLNNLGIAYERQGRDEEARALYAEVLALARKLGRKPAEANCLNNLGTVEDRLGDYEAALAYLAECRNLWRELGDLDGDAVALANIGAVHLHRGDFPAALACLAEALPVARSFGNRIGEAEIHTDLGRALAALGRYGEARASLARAVQLWSDLDDPRWVETTAELAAIEAR